MKHWCKPAPLAELFCANTWRLALLGQNLLPGRDVSGCAPGHETILWRLFLFKEQWPHFQSFLLFSRFQCLKYSTDNYHGKSHGGSDTFVFSWGKKKTKKARWCSDWVVFFNSSMITSSKWEQISDNGSRKIIPLKACTQEFLIEVSKLISFQMILHCLAI